MSAPRPRDPVLTPAVRPIERIVVPVEGSDREYDAQMWAIQQAADMRVPVVAIHVGEPHEADASERDVRDKFRYLEKECSEWNVPFELLLLRGGKVGDEIVQELGPRDLVVIGTRRLGTQYHLGSLAAELVRRAPCPVEVVRLE